MKHALILGVGGQDGSYLCEHLLSLGYRVTGTYRRSSVDNLWRIEDVLGHAFLELVEFDLSDAGSIRSVISDHVDLDTEVYNLADQDHVGSSKDTPEYSADVTYGGAARVMEAMFHHAPVTAKLFQPSSATIFGDQHTHPCDENADFNPQSPYAVAKLGALYLARYYRSRGLRVWCGILYGHASIRQKPEYLVHRIAKQAVDFARDRYGRTSFDIEDSKFRVDVGWAWQFAKGFHAMLQTETPDDYVLSSGRGVPLWEIASHALHEAGVPTGEIAVKIGKDTDRCVIGDCSKAKAAFGWNPERDAMDVVENLVDFYSQEKS